MKRVATAAGLLAAWNLVGYPLYLALRARRGSTWTAAGGARGARGARQKLKSIAMTPSVLLAARDEAAGIAARIENLLEQDGVLEVLVASDASDDGTDEIVKAIAARNGRVRFVRQERAGKVAALRRLAREARGDVLVVTDANARFAPGAVRALVEALSDGEVGAACGDLRLAPASAAGHGENAYWSYETWIKRNASEAGLLLMGAGAIYAVRKDDWDRIERTLPIPHDFADDSYVPLFLAIEGKRNRFVPEAVAYEMSGSSLAGEWRRRVRMVSQDGRLMFRLPLWKNPEVAFAFFSQKVLRWLLFPLGLLAAGGVAASGPAAAAVVGIGTGVTGAVVWSLARGGEPPRALATPAYLVAATAGAFVGFLRALAGRSEAVWDAAPGTRWSAQ